MDTYGWEVRILPLNENINEGISDKTRYSCDGLLNNIEDKFNLRFQISKIRLGRSKKVLLFKNFKDTNLIN